MIPLDRKKLDSRRVGAVILDGLLFAPILALSFGYEAGIQVLVTALWLVYHYVADTTTGQSVGKSVFKLRTVTLDGQIVSGRAAAGRTILRLVDHSIVGLIVMIATGQRRQRLGDLAAGTAVVDARDVVVTRAFDRSMLGYPLAWLAPALLVFTLTAMGRFPGSYRVEADTICEQADAVAPTLKDPLQILELARGEAAELRRLTAPPHWRDRHAALVEEYASHAERLERAMRRTANSTNPDATWQREAARLQRRAARMDARLAPLGYQVCASGESAA